VKLTIRELGDSYDKNVRDYWQWCCVTLTSIRNTLQSLARDFFKFRKCCRISTGNSDKENKVSFGTCCLAVFLDKPTRCQVALHNLYFESTQWYWNSLKKPQHTLNGRGCNATPPIFVPRTRQSHSPTKLFHCEQRQKN